MTTQVFDPKTLFQKLAFARRKTMLYVYWNKSPLFQMRVISNPLTKSNTNIWIKNNIISNFWTCITLPDNDLAFRVGNIIHCLKILIRELIKFSLTNDYIINSLWKKLTKKTKDRYLGKIPLNGKTKFTCKAHHIGLK